MRLYKTLFGLLLIGLMLNIGCKAKRCASFENQDKDYKLRYDSHGRVKK